MTADQVKNDDQFPVFSIGDTLDVHVRIIEGEKERIQVYQGVLIARNGRGVSTRRSPFVASSPTKVLNASSR